ncbi:MAG: PAS domain-containing protein [Chloroflexi bacterium]|nr:PAS domain-containing protein [Chloroflexota bacterium]
MSVPSRRQSMRGRILLALLVAFLPLVALEAYLLEGQAQALRSRIVDERQALVTSEARAADEFIVGNIRALQALAKTNAITDPTGGQLNTLLRSITDGNPVWITVALSGSDGFNISSLTAPARSVSIADRDYFRGAVAGTPTVGTAILARSTGVKTLVVAVPVTLAAGGRAVLSAALSLTDVEKELGQALPPSTQLVIVDRLGQQFIGAGPVADTFPVVKGQTGVDAVLRGETDAVVTSVDGREQLVAYAPAPLAGWGVILRESTVSAFAEIDRQRTTALAFAGAATLVALLIAALLASHLERTYVEVQRASEELERSRIRVTAERDLLGRIVDEMPVAVAIYDAQGKAIIRNRTYSQVLGGKPPPDLGQALAFYDIRTPDGLPMQADDHPTQRALRGQTVRGAEVAVRHADTGAEVHILVDAIPLRDPAGVNGALVVFQDITTLREVERQRVAFFDMASHEIKTPLTALLGHVQLAQRRVRTGKTEELGDVLARAERGGQRLVELVKDLLDVSRLDEGRLEIVHEPFDLGQLVEEVADGIRPTLEKQVLRVERAAGATIVDADSHRVTQILQNLIDNAVRYSPEGGPIDVTVSRDGGEAIVRVSDRGIGVPEAEQPMLFQRFFRTSRALPYGGTGLGLFISRRIAEAHRGRLWLEKSGPDGSVFALALPLASLVDAGGTPQETEPRPVSAT